MKKFNITVNGVSYEVDVEEIKDGAAPAPRAAAPAPRPAAPAAPKAAPAAKPAAKPAAPVASPAGATTVEAPMPGNIWKIEVKEGQAVKEGQVLLILEAMKMENEIMAPADGTVAAIHVSEGASVNGGDVLVSLK
ncbi:biotin/lipoyl-containing protein [Alkaliphilus hydrothermalis]|uniref:Biotin carboxyl carrier protein n=1 Tax=Alkaliphilus hydrothermalis TaxID=1482730 RepID=A0ABS2NSN7_9FIRM|nr:biotin/lipoyl-containing protein [Alkaliphilus hydrothermalis]MBM7615979.1 biotin carboxyl carrier protein [Alkaliphilus hydrothermalis]